MKDTFLRFSVETLQVALPIGLVVQILPMVETTDLPGAPDVIFGLIQYKEDLIPVYHLRKRFNLTDRSPELTDQLIVVKTPTQVAALWIDQCIDLIEIDEEEIIDIPPMAQTKHFKGVIRKKEDLFFIQDMDQFLEDQELIQLKEILAKEKHHKE